MQQANPGEAVPVTYATRRQRLELEYGELLEDWGIHDCCCSHVVETLSAIPAPEQELYAAARERYYRCPHHWLTDLEIYLGTMR